MVLTAHIHISAWRHHEGDTAEIDFLAKQFAIRFGFVILVVSWSLSKESYFP